MTCSDIIELGKEILREQKKQRRIRESDDIDWIYWDRVLRNVRLSHNNSWHIPDAARWKFFDFVSIDNGHKKFSWFCAFLLQRGTIHEHKSKRIKTLHEGFTGVTFDEFDCGLRDTMDFVQKHTTTNKKWLMPLALLQYGLEHEDRDVWRAIWHIAMSSSLEKESRFYVSTSDQHLVMCVVAKTITDLVSQGALERCGYQQFKFTYAPVPIRFWT